MQYDDLQYTRHPLSGSLYPEFAVIGVSLMSAPKAVVAGLTGLRELLIAADPDVIAKDGDAIDVRFDSFRYGFFQTVASVTSKDDACGVISVAEFLSETGAMLCTDDAVVQRFIDHHIRDPRPSWNQSPPSSEHVSEAR